MAKAKPTVTTGRLHFDDLHDRRFEDLCHVLIYPRKNWVEMNHIGRLGNDGGHDINAVEELEDGKFVQWVIQCKRYKSITPKEATDALDTALASLAKPMDVFQLVVGCDVQRAVHEKLKSHAAAKGVADVLIWDATLIESMLYNERPDLLFIYFGVNVRQATQNREALVKKRLQIKNNLRRDLREKHPSNREDRDGLFPFNCSNLMIHNVNDDTYPNYPPIEQPGISPFFKVETFDFYHNGIEVALRGVTAIFDSENHWDIIDYDDPRRGRYPSATVVKVGRMPFDYIVTYDLTTDEYGAGPHIYCRFANDKGEPWDEFAYYASVNIAGRHSYTRLRPELWRKLPDTPLSSPPRANTAESSSS